MNSVRIDRWIMRRQRKILLYSVALFLVLVVYISMFQEDIKIKESHYQPFSENCLPGAAENLIQSICSNFSKGLAYGSFCQDLCIDKSVKVDKCIHHGTTYVLMAENNGDGIVMKLKKTRDISFSIQIFEGEISRDSSISNIRKSYFDRVKDEVRSSFGDDTLQLFLKNINTFSNYIFNKNISDLSLIQMRSSWQTIGQDELLMTLIHQKLKSFTNYIGLCGPMYVIERTKSYSEYFPEVVPRLSWDKRVRIAKGFLKLLKDFEATDIGPLHHCDIQESNFGLTKEYDVKAIDVDLIYGNNRMNELLVSPQCSKDEDCEFFDCTSKCNTAESKCTGETLSNNLQVVCRDIFLPQWPMSGLLSYFRPSYVENKLTRLLDVCRSKGFGSLSMNHSRVIKMMEDIENTLNYSLKIKATTPI